MRANHLILALAAFPLSISGRSLPRSPSISADIKTTALTTAENAALARTNFDTTPKTADRPYKLVFGPQAGCADVARSTPAQRLDSGIQSMLEATTVCQHLCSERSDCGSVFANRLYVSWPRGTPYWECHFHQGRLNVAEDLECGKQEGIWGAGVGFDVESG